MDYAIIVFLTLASILYGVVYYRTWFASRLGEAFGEAFFSRVDVVEDGIPRVNATRQLIEANEILSESLRDLIEQFDVYRKDWMGPDTWRDRIGLPEDLDNARRALVANDIIVRQISQGAVYRLHGSVYVTPFEASVLIEGMKVWGERYTSGDWQDKQLERLRARLEAVASQVSKQSEEVKQ